LPFFLLFALCLFKANQSARALQATVSRTFTQRLGSPGCVTDYRKIKIVYSMTIKAPSAIAVDLSARVRVSEVSLVSAGQLQAAKSPFFIERSGAS